jgi:hypothetical protein
MTEDGVNGSLGIVTGIVLALILQGSASAQETPAAGVTKLKEMAVGSRCAAHNWNEGKRGFAPKSYIAGMALVFARAVCQSDRADTKVVSTRMDRNAEPDDALVVYADRFASLGMSNDTTGRDTLRHSYTLLIGLGMMESSGKFCEGRDVSQCFVQADSAEAGPFQTSFGVHSKSPALDTLIQKYTADRNGCMLDVFQGNVTCKIRKSSNPRCPDVTSDVTGTGPGADWQRLTKSCPAFAIEYGAVVVRKHGGPRGEFNPIRKRQAEVRPECDSMLRQVQTFVEQNPNVCSAL